MKKKKKKDFFRERDSSPKWNQNKEDEPAKTFNINNWNKLWQQHEQGFWQKLDA